MLLSRYLKNVYENIMLKQTVFGMTWAIASGCLAYAVEQKTISFFMVFLLITTYCFARFSGMCWNRYLDRVIDAKNPRTKNRALAQKRQSPKEVFLQAVCFLSVALYIAHYLHTYTFWITCFGLFLLVLYSFTKRFTYLSHFFLGLVLALAPFAVWVEITQSFSLAMGCFSLALLLSIAAQDIIYAFQDVEFDRRHELFSVPAAFGEKKALVVVQCLHIAACFLLLTTGIFFQVRGPFYIGIFACAVIYIFGHLSLKKQTFAKAQYNQVFTKANTYCGCSIMVASIGEVLCVL